MKLDHCDNAVITEEQAVQLCLCDGNLDGVFVDHAHTAQQFNRSVQRLQSQGPQLCVTDADQSRAQWHQALSSQWLMPDHYAQLDIHAHVLSRTHNQAQALRAQQELAVYESHGLLDLLRYLVYMVDTMQQHGVVWGVGRGSSVASYVLYVIGINSIDPMQHDLHMDEFLKERTHT